MLTPAVPLLLVLVIASLTSPVSSIPSPKGVQTTACRFSSKSDHAYKLSRTERQHSLNNLTAYLSLIRGGYGDYDKSFAGTNIGDDDNSSEDGEDDYDDEDEDDINDAGEDDATAMHQQRRNLQRNPASQQPQQQSGQQQQQPGGSSSRTRAPYIPRQTKKKSLATRIAKSSLSFSKKAVGTTVKSSGKAAFYLMRPKSVKESELWGVWRLDQQVGMKQSTANIELTKRGFVILREGDDVVWKAPYRFVQPTWPKLPRVEFEARGFQPNKDGKDGRAWVLFYKGSLERKIADKSVIKMVGKLYEIERPKSMFGKELPVRYNKIGSFVGRRRIVITDDSDDEDESDEYDEQEGEQYGSDVEGNGRDASDDEYDDEDL